MNIWKSEQWREVLDVDNNTYRTGLYLRFDKGTDPYLREECKAFARWLRERYAFPIRVVIYFKNKEKILCRDGGLAAAAILMPDSYKDEPYIRVAVGEFPLLMREWGTIEALYSVLSDVAHELTHYYQWINGFSEDKKIAENQASAYAGRILIMGYQAYWEERHPELVDQWIEEHTVEEKC